MDRLSFSRRNHNPPIFKEDEMRKFLLGTRRATLARLVACVVGSFATIAAAGGGLDVLGTGYWKNHLANDDPAGPWYSTECTTIREHGGHCRKDGPWAIEYLPHSLGNYPVNNITKAADILTSLKCGKGKHQVAVGCLAGQLLATKLNLASGSLACIEILQVVADADAFLKGITVHGVPGIPYLGPDVDYPLTSSQRELALDLKDDLEDYNSDIGCP